MKSKVGSNKIKQYVRHSLAEISTVYKVMSQQLKQAELEQQMIERQKGQINGLLVKVGTLRLRTFLYKGTQCDICGLKATHFALERDVASEIDSSYHLNLWGIKEGQEILFTHDHIRSRACGGKDDISNSRTCCSLCNENKSNMEWKLKELLKNKDFVLTKEWMQEHYVNASEDELNKVYEAFCL